MASTQAVPKIDPSLLSGSRRRTDEIFSLLPPNSYYERPVPERHRLIFYLGHLEAFDWNLLHGPLGISSNESTFDNLFAFGIDPVGGGLPTDAPEQWPNIAQVEKYNRGVRARIDDALQNPGVHTNKSVLDGTLLHVAIEHRLMHAETLAYLLHNLPADKKVPHGPSHSDSQGAPRQREVTIPSGTATLGKRRGQDFGWDNEFGEQAMFVPSFSVDVFPVTNQEYLKFVRTGGYQNPKVWSAQDQEWLRQQRVSHPHFWAPLSSAGATDPDTEWEYRTMFGTIPLPLAWPVYVTHAEASAFARWSGKKLPTETQWHRAAYGTPEGHERAYPWGEEAPEATRGNFHYARWDANRVDAYPQGASAWGVMDLLGNGWEWTSTPFGPLDGFEPFPFYLGYSADFFDGKHFVMKGGSPRTDACMLRRSFRNWFQPHYPYVYATFRCVED